MSKKQFVLIMTDTQRLDMVSCYQDVGIKTPNIDALAAEGVAGPVMNLVILAISGLCIGAGVLMSEAFGARDDGKVRREMATVSVFGFWFSCEVCCQIVSGDLERVFHIEEKIRARKDAELAQALEAEKAASSGTDSDV